MKEEQSKDAEPSEISARLQGLVARNHLAGKTLLKHNSRPEKVHFRAIQIILINIRQKSFISINIIVLKFNSMGIILHSFT